MRYIYLFLALLFTAPAFADASPCQWRYTFDSNNVATATYCGNVVSGSSINLPSVAAMIALPSPQPGNRVTTSGYYAGSSKGAGTYMWITSTTVCNSVTGGGNGGTVICGYNGTNYISTGYWSLQGYQTVNLYMFGCHGDGVTDDSACINNAFVAASQANVGLYIPTGTYLYNNSVAPINAALYTSVSGDGGTATITCTNTAKPCMAVTVPSNSNIYWAGFSVTYSSTPSVRVDGATAVHISGGNYVSLSNMFVYGGPAAGIIIDGGTNSYSITDSFVHDMLANGVIISNANSGTIDGLTSMRNQDAGLEMSTYGNSFTGDVSVTNYYSKFDYTGVLFNSTTRASLSNFIIRDTYVHAIVIRQDAATTTTVWPDLTNISNGTITGVGSKNPANPAVRAIYFMAAANTPTYKMRTSVSNVTIDGMNTGASAVFIENDSHFDTTLNTVSVTNAGDNSFDLGGGTVTASNLKSNTPTNYAYVLRNTLAFTGFNLSSTNAQTSGNSTNAFLNLSTGVVNLNGFQSTETGATAHGAVADSATSGQHTFNGVSYSFADGTNPKVINTYSNPGFSAGPVAANGAAYTLGPITMTGLSNNGINMQGLNNTINSGDTLILQSASNSYIRPHSGYRLNIDSGNGLSVSGAISGGKNVVTYSSTPTFDLNLGNVQMITLTGNVSIPVLSNLAAWPGALVTFVICQDATGSRTFSWPASVRGGGTIATTANKCNIQSFISDGSYLYAISAMSTGI